MSESGRGANVRGVMAYSAISWLMSLVPFGNCLFTFPILLLYKRAGKKSADTACVAVMVLVVLKTLYTYRGIGDLTHVFISVDLFMPIAFTLGAVVWMHTGGKALFFRVSLMAAPTLVLYICSIALFTLTPEAVEVYLSATREILRVLFQEGMGFGEETLGRVTEMFLVISVSFICPMALALMALVTFLSESGMAEDKASFDDEVGRYLVPEWFVYPFLLFWALVLLKRWVALPLQADILVNAIAILIAVLYAFQGFAVIVYKVRMAHRAVRSTRILWMLLLPIAFFMGMNIFLCAVVTFLGVLDTWVQFRKPKEFSNEDYS